MASLPGGFSWIDLVILLIIGGGVLRGYTQGLLRQIVGLAVLYLATILATQNYLPLSNWVYSIYHLPATRLANALTFLFILFTVSFLINLLADDAYRMTKVKIAPVVDQLGGAFLGLVTVIIVLIFLLPILRFVSNEPFPYFDGLRVAILQGLQGSQFLPLILYYRPIVLGTITPWIPGGLPSIFE